LADGTDFQSVIENEVKRISRYRLHKMKAAGMINILSSSMVPSDDPEEPPLPEMDANYLKRLNIGPLAKDFYFDGYRPKKKVSIAPEPPKPPKKKCKVCPNYCICVKGKGVRRPDYDQVKKPGTCSDSTNDGSKRCSKSEESPTPPPMEGAEEDEEEDEEMEGEFEDYAPKIESAEETMVDDIVNEILGPEPEPEPEPETEPKPEPGEAEGLESSPS